MTDNPESADPRRADGQVNGSDAGGEPGNPAERIVIRNRRKIDPNGGPRHAAETDAARESDDSAPATADEAAGTPDGARPAGESGSEGAPPSVGHGLGAELEALRTELEERTRDLQRVTAEYANYRKRVDRDRGLAAEQTTGAVLYALLPVLDDLDRAREHGDLVGPFGTVAEHLIAALSKFGLTAFGEKGDPFDPTRHEAVAHLTSDEVQEPTCVDVMRRGYALGERLLRPALVAVADPA